MCKAEAVINFHTIVGLATEIALTNGRILLKETGYTVDGVKVSSKN